MFNQGTNQPRTRTRFFYGYIVVIVSLCIITVTFGTRISFGVFLKPIISDFGWSRALISGAYSISVVVQGFFSIVMGGLNDRLGPRKVLTICGLLLGIGYLLMSQINAAWQLYLLFIVLVGIGMSGFFVPILSTVARWFVKRRSVMTGIVLAGIGTGNIISPPVFSWFISNYGWRTSYIIMGSLSLVIIILAVQFLKRDPAQIGQVPYGENEGVEQDLDSGIDGFSFKDAAYTRQFWLLFALFFCIGFCFFTITVHIVPHATDLGISEASAANILAIMGVAGLIGSIVLGGAADRIGNKRIFIMCFILLSAALFCLVPAREMWMLYLLVSLLNFGCSGGGAVESPLVAELFGIKSHGLIFGFVSLGFTIGAAAGPFIAGYVFDVTGSYQMAFLLCAAFAVVGLILAIILRPIKRIGVPI